MATGRIMELGLGGIGLSFPESVRTGPDAFEVRQGGLMVRTTVQRFENGVRLAATLVNDSDEAVLPGDLCPFGPIDVTSTPSFDKAHLVCRDMLGFAGPQPLDRAWSSFGVVGLTDDPGTAAMSFGFTDPSGYFAHFKVQKEGGGVRVVPCVPFELSSVPARSEVDAPVLEIVHDSSLVRLLEGYAEAVAANLRTTPAVFGERPTGYCSWYSYYGTETQEDLLAILEGYRTSPMKGRLTYFLIDGGWNEEPGDKEYNWGDWHSGGKFPQGMKHISDRIHDFGFRSGLWVAPFAVTKNSSVFRDHPEWIVGQGKDLMNNGGDTVGLDLSHPEVQRFVRETLHRILDEWGFDYIKIDFLLYGALAGERYDNRVTSAAAFREGMRIVRECAGDRLVLNCGSPLFQSAGYCDAMRIGPDVGSRWYFPLNEGVWQYGNCCVKAGMRYIVHTQWMNRILWHNDPDCLVARSRSNGVEYRKFRDFFPTMAFEEAEFGLSRNEFLAFGKLIWMTQGLFFLSDPWEGIDEGYRKEVLLLSEPHAQDFSLVDWYARFDVSVFQSRSGPKRIGLFNIGDSAETVRIPAARFGLKKWAFREMTESIAFEGEGEVVVFPELPGRTGYIFTVVE